MDHVTVGVLGASGYVGGELIQRLAVHPHVTMAFLGAGQHAGASVAQVFPHLRYDAEFAQRRFQSLDDLPMCDLLIAALPSGALPACVAHVAPRTQRILNVAGDYRLSDARARAHFYPQTAPLPDGVTTMYAVPEFAQNPAATIVNLPGCMAVAAIYALMPLVDAGVIQEHIVIDAKTGSSGAGHKAAQNHAERAGGMTVHMLTGHRHGMEIAEFLSARGRRPLSVAMSTTSIDVARGVLVHAHGHLNRRLSTTAVQQLYRDYYRHHHFIRVTQEGGTLHGMPATKTVIGTNFCAVACAANRAGQFTAVAVLDNLVKGAAGNALQMMNRLYDFPQTAGLAGYGVWP